MNSNDEIDNSAKMAADDNDCRNIFEEERKALLNGYVKAYSSTVITITLTNYHLPNPFRFSMASKMQSVIKRMSEINKRLKDNSKDCESVSTLSELWQQSYMISRDEQTKDNNRMAESSLLVRTKH